MSRWRPVAAGLALAAAGAWAARTRGGSGEGAPRLQPDRPPTVIAHRGGSLLWPENTLAAFRGALSLHVDAIEFDLRLTADGEIVVLHDETLDRTTNGSGPLRALSLAQVQRLDAGYRWTADGGRSYPFRGQGLQVPTLAEVLEVVAGTALVLEIKEPDAGLIGRLRELVDVPAWRERVIVASFHDAAIRRFRRECPAVATSTPAGESRRMVAAATLSSRPLYRPPAVAVQIPERYGPIRAITPNLIAAAHAQGMAVHAWTINDPDAMRRLLGMGVDGIVTDRPDLLLRITGRS